MSMLQAPRPQGERDRLLVHANSAQQVLHLLQRPGGVPGDPTKTVMLDPALTAAVVRAANSAHLGYSGRIGGVRQATVMLGGTLVASLAASRVADLVFDPSPPEYPDWLWPHSLAVACGCAVLAKRTGESVDDAYTAGLLHDVGWLLMASNGLPVDNADTDHARIGAALLSRWNFPAGIVSAVKHHHSRPAALVSMLDRIVVAAHGIAKGMGVASPEASISKLDALRLVDLPGVRASIIIAEVEQELTNLTSEIRSKR
jgi:putative nucleotidyltransferase with HDIG domain